MNKILIADDAEINREILSLYFEEDYEVLFAENGQEVIDYFDHGETISILLLDLYMPVMNGIEVLKKLHERHITDHVPVIVISGESAVEIEAEVFDYGATDFIHKPFDGRIVIQRVRNTIELFSTKNGLEERVREQTEELRTQYEVVQRKNEELEQKTRELEDKTEQLRKTNTKIIDVLGTTVEFRHMDSYQHIRRVKAFTRVLAQQFMKDHPEYEMTQEQVDLIVDASSLHDIGKISISDSILLKPGRLTNEEFDEMKTHTTKGGMILKHVKGIWDDQYGQACYEICMYHHERYDGRGYPEGLHGDNIPLSAQIVSVVDVYDALVCKRVYKDAFPKDVAANMILNGECGVFSPKLLESFENCRKQIEELAEFIVDV